MNSIESVGGFFCQRKCGFLVLVWCSNGGNIRQLQKAELKKDAMFKAYEQLQLQLSSFTLPWKDLEDHLDGIRRSLERHSDELDDSERSLTEQVLKVASREDGLWSAWQRVQECEEEVQRKKMDLRSVEERLEKCRGERKEEESQLVVKRDALRECTSLIRDKKGELSYLKHVTDECRRDYDSKKEELELLRQELELKEKKVGLMQSLLEKIIGQLKPKVEELTRVQSRLDHSLKEHDDSEKRLSVLEQDGNMRWWRLRNDSPATWKNEQSLWTFSSALLVPNDPHCRTTIVRLFRAERGPSGISPAGRIPNT